MKIVNMIKGNQRYNGQRSFSSDSLDDKFKFVKNVNKINSLHQQDSSKLRNHKSESEIAPDNGKHLQPSFSVPAPKIKREPEESDLNNKVSAHSIIGLSGKTKSSKLNSSSTAHLKRNSNWNSYHESLQRIDSTDLSYNHYQKHWFSTSLEKLKLEEKSREERLEITRYELRRHLKQITKSNLGKSNFPVELVETVGPEALSSSKGSKQNIGVGYDRLVPTKNCEIENCSYPALPCTNYCTMHIMHNSEQVLFAYCTAKFADNTQCSMPVFDITHELPLCPEHARKRDNYKLYQETKPKKVRKKVKPSAMIRPQKRNKKKKKPVKPPETSSSSPPPTSASSTATTSNTNIVNERVIDAEICDESADLSQEMVEEVLDLQETDGLELVSVEQSLVSHATNLLEESDITTVLSTIPAEEFSDFFSVNRNGEYEPTREETEELERALAAVDNDVKSSLEKLGQTQGLLDPFLDDHTLVESLVQIPDIFHNGYSASCGESMVTQTSRLLPVEPHSHS